MEANSLSDCINTEENVKEPYSIEQFLNVDEQNEKTENDCPYDDRSQITSNTELCESSEGESIYNLKQKSNYLKTMESNEKEIESLEQSSCSESEHETKPGALVKVSKKSRPKRALVEKLFEKNDKGERTRSQCSICGKLYVSI